jgi:amino acid permease
MGFRSMVHATSEADKSGWLAMYSRERIMILFWLCIMLPLSLQRHMERLEKFSSLGVLSIIVLVISATIHSISHGEIFASEKHDTEQESVHAVDFGSMLWPNSFWDVVQAFPIIIFAFSCQVNVCAIFEELNTCTDTKEKTMKRITRSGITLCISLYLAIGCFGYLDFAHGTVSNENI